jgi:hypothetical protein
MAFGEPSDHDGSLLPRLVSLIIALIPLLPSLKYITISLALSLSVVLCVHDFGQHITILVPSVPWPPEGFYAHH